jgi:hypothetical protein
MDSSPMNPREERSEADSADPRSQLLSFVYQEALRGLTHQQNVVADLNARAGNLIFATAFATSLLGTKALSDGLAFWDWAAVVLLFLLGALFVFMLWPYYNYTFRFDPADLLAEFVDREPPAPMADVHRALSVRIKTDMARNWRIIQPIRVALQLALILLLLEVLAWLLAIGHV